MIILQFLLAWFAILISVTYSITPVEVVGSKFFVRNGNQFYIKGVDYTIDEAGSDPFANSAQCAIDASSIKALGANTIRSTYHFTNFASSAITARDACMKSFSDNGIYVLIPLWIGYGNQPNSTYDLNEYNYVTSVMDAFQKYENVLGFELHFLLGVDARLKAVFRDLRAYRGARGYRSIPIGYNGPSGDLDGNYVSTANYSTCPSLDTNGATNYNTTAEFYSIGNFDWCGSSSYTQSGYNVLTTRFAPIGVPVFFAQVGCTIKPNTFTNQGAIFGPQMVDIWSGAVIYSWRISAYQIVTYPSAATATPTPLQDYTYLSSQWATLTPTGATRPSTKTYPLCPTTNSQWTINSAATIPTIAGLNLATVSPVSSQTSSATSPSSSSGGGQAAQSNGLSQGAAIGIGVGLGLLLIIGVVLFFFLRRRKRNKQHPVLTTNNGLNMGEKSEMYAGPVDSTIAGKVSPKSELHASSGIHRKPLPSELHGKPSMAATSHELPSPTGSNAPWIHGAAGYMPPELNSNPIYEASQGHQRTAASESHGINSGPFRSSTEIAEENGFRRLAPALSPAPVPAPAPALAVQDLGFNESELAEEADVAVQELGLISVRKRNLTSAALAAGVRPEDLPGRKGEEYAELLQREQRVRARLEEIEKQRRNLA